MKIIQGVRQSMTCFDSGTIAGVKIESTLPANLLCVKLRLDKVERS